MLAMYAYCMLHDACHNNVVNVDITTLLCTFKRLNNNYADLCSLSMFVKCSKVQARSAFATYLTCIQQRLVTETRNPIETETETANEQMVCIQSISVR